MEWTQFIIFFLGVFGLFVWNRAEGRADARHMEAQLRANSELIRAIHEETHQEIRAIHDETHQEMKDFHGRLCAIEERNRNST